LSFGEADQRAVLEGAFSLLRPSAPFIQFTYGLTVPVRGRILRDLGVTGTRTSRTWRNLPPVTVHVLRLGRIWMSRNWNDQDAGKRPRYATWPIPFHAMRILANGRWSWRAPPCRPEKLHPG